MVKDLDFFTPDVATLIRQQYRVAGIENAIASLGSERDGSS